MLAIEHPDRSEAVRSAAGAGGLRGPVRATIGTGEVVDALEEVLGWIGRWGRRPAGEELLRAAIEEVAHLGERLRKLSTVDPCLTHLWPNDTRTAAVCAELSWSLGGLAVEATERLGGPPGVSSNPTQTLRQTFVIGLGGGEADRSAQRALDLIATILVERSSGTSEGGQPPRSALLRDLDAVAGDLRQLAAMAHRLTADARTGTSRPPWRKLAIDLATELERLAGHAEEEVHRADR